MKPTKIRQRELHSRAKKQWSVIEKGIRALYLRPSMPELEADTEDFIYQMSQYFKQGYEIGFKEGVEWTESLMKISTNQG